MASDSNNKSKLTPETGFGAANFTSGMSEEVTIMNEEDAEDEEVEGAIGDRTLEEALKRASAEAAAVDMDPGTDATADVTADDAALETQDDSNTAKPSKKVDMWNPHCIYMLWYCIVLVICVFVDCKTVLDCYCPMIVSMTFKCFQFF